ncbi:39S ribosomal protein L48, mitochondrial isoform X1 [Mugil cephalus]|uniref:39S ribosomal protein L48, mitochondrial isoform X1 n=1 Tax=Mugil cephalus TaxID=48193 RepID=UPI001FB6C9E4|nr:39S ribosomal protein L48, mitochondrial isoform X1 [Mugil cephalus]
MNHILRKVSVVRQAVVLNQALTSCRATPSIQHPVWCAASVNERQYRSMPTHGIGRWKHLLTKRPPRKKKGPIQMRPILPATSQAYGTLNVKVSGYDMTLVEHYYQYVHNLCIRLGIKVAYSYALPTKSTEVMLMQEQSSKMYIDSVLKTHERVVQLSRLKATTCPIFIEVLLKNQPEGVQLSVTEHTEADFHARFKVRPQLQELRAQITSKASL